MSSNLNNKLRSKLFGSPASIGSGISNATTTNTLNQRLRERLGIATTTQPENKEYQPLPNVKTVNFPGFFGGGQYKVNVDDPNKVVTSTRAYGDMPTKEGYERNHIFPVALGGTSENPNMEYLESKKNIIQKIFDKPASAKNRQEGRVLVEQSAINDYQSGKISLAEARMRVLNWDNQPEPFYKTLAKEFTKTLNKTNPAYQLKEGVKGLVTKAIPEAIKNIDSFMSGDIKQEAATQFIEGLTGVSREFITSIKDRKNDYFFQQPVRKQVADVIAEYPATLATVGSEILKSVFGTVATFSTGFNTTKVIIPFSKTRIPGFKDVELTTLVGRAEEAEQMGLNPFMQAVYVGSVIAQDSVFIVPGAKFLAGKVSKIPVSKPSFTTLTRSEMVDITAGRITEGPKLQAYKTLVEQFGGKDGSIINVLKKAEGAPLNIRTGQSKTLGELFAEEWSKVKQSEAGFAKMPGKEVIKSQKINKVLNVDRLPNGDVVMYHGTNNFNEIKKSGVLDPFKSKQAVTSLDGKYEIFVSPDKMVAKTYGKKVVPVIIPKKQFEEWLKNTNKMAKLMRAEGANSIEIEMLYTELNSNNQLNIYKGLPITTNKQRSIESQDFSKQSLQTDIPKEIVKDEGDFISVKVDKKTGMPISGKGLIPTSDDIINLTLNKKEYLSLGGDKVKIRLYLKNKLDNLLQPEQSLQAEAKKYKSAEEFADAQGEVLYHSSPDKFASGKPEFDAFFGNKEWKEAFGKEFGVNEYEVILPKGRKILDLDSGSTDANNIIKKWGGTKDDFYSEDWTDKTKIFPEIKKLGYEGAKFQDEFILSKELIKEIKTKSQLTDIWNKANKATPKADFLPKKDTRFINSFLEKGILAGYSSFGKPIEGRLPSSGEFNGVYANVEDLKGWVEYAKEIYGENGIVIEFRIPKNKYSNVRVDEDIDDMGLNSKIEDGDISPSRAFSEGSIVYLGDIKPEWISAIYDTNINKIYENSKPLVVDFSPKLYHFTSPRSNFQKKGSLNRPSILDIKKVPVTKSIKQAQEIIDRLKLSNVVKEIADIILTYDGSGAFGAALGNTVYFEKTTPKFTGKHEVIHVIHRNVDKIKLFKKYGITKAKLDAELERMSGGKDIREILAENGELRSQYQENIKQTTWLKRFFAMVRDFFSRIFNKKNGSIVRKFLEIVEKGKAKESTFIPPEPAKYQPKIFTDNLGRKVVSFMPSKPGKTSFLSKGMSAEEEAIMEAEFAKDFTPSNDVIDIIKNEGGMTVTKDVRGKDMKLRMSDEMKELQKQAPYLFKASTSGAMDAQEMIQRLNDEYGYKIGDEQQLAEVIKKAQKNRNKFKASNKSIAEFRNEVDTISQEVRDKIIDVELPPASKVARPFGLLGNKATSVSLFNDIYDRWVKDGADIIIEPYAGAYTIGANSLRNASQNGLREYHANIYDKEKYIVIKAIQDGKLDEIKRIIDKIVRQFSDTMLLKAKEQDPELHQIFTDFLAKDKTNYIGNNSFAFTMRKNRWQSRIKNYAEDYERVRKILQDTYDDLASVEVTNLETALTRAFIEKAGHFGNASQNLITRDGGFKSLENAIYGKYGMIGGLEQVDASFKFTRENGTKTYLYGPERDGMDVVNELAKKYDPAQLGIYSDPPYVKSAKVYAKKSTELDKFTTGEKFVASHKTIFDLEKQGARVAFTNDIDEEYITTMLGSITKSTGKLFAYREGNTPTTMIMSDESFYIADEFFAIGDKGYTRMDKWADLEYLAKTIRHGGYTAKTIQRLKEHGVKDEIINALKINTEYLVDLIKVKIEANGEVSTTISKKAIDYIKYSSKIKTINKNEYIALGKYKKFIVKKKENLGEIIQGYETGHRFFKRIGKGFEDLIFNPIMGGEIKMVQELSRLKKEVRSIFKLKKKDRILLTQYAMKKMGVKVPTGVPTWNELPDNIKKAYTLGRSVFDKLYPQIKKVATKNGRDPGNIENYWPLYTADDMRIILNGNVFGYTGDLKMARKDPVFGSLKERVDNVPYEMYELDAGKVLDTYLTGATKYIHVGSRTLTVKYLIESNEFSELVDKKIYNIIRAWYQYIVNPPIPNISLRSLRTLRTLKAVAILGLKYGVILKQPLNLFEAMGSLGVGTVLKASYKVLRGHTPMTAYAKMSGSVLERSLGYEIQDLHSVITDFLGAPARYMDRLTARIIHVATMDAYIKMHLAENNNKIKARDYRRYNHFADEVVRGIMGGTTSSEIPAYFRTEGGKVINMFSSQLVGGKLQYYTTDIWKDPRYAKLAGGKYKLLLRSLGIFLLINAFVENMINDLDTPDLDDPGEFIYEMAKQLASNFPLIGSAWFSIESGKPFAISPIASNITALMQAISRNDPVDIMWESAGFLGFSNQIKNIIQGGGAIRDGGVYDKNGKLLFPVSTPMDKVRVLLKGKWGSKAGQEYFSKDKEFEDIYNSYTKAVEKGDKQKVAEILQDITDAQADKIVKKLKEEQGDQKVTDKQLMQYWKKIKDAKEKGDMEKVKELISAMSDEEADRLSKLIEKSSE